VATTVVETIGVGKDYSTLAAWEAATDINLVAADEVRVGVLYGQVAETLRVQSATVDSTRYRVLRGAEPYSPWDDEGPKINGRLIVAEQYFRCENLGIELQTDDGVPTVNISAANSRFDGVLAKDTITTGQRVFDAKTFAATFLNCIAVGFRGDVLGGSRGFYGSGAVTCDHCVAIGMGGSGASTVLGHGFYLTNAAAVCTNSIAIGSQTQDFLISSGTKTTCISGDGSGNITSKTLVETFVDFSIDDYRPLAGGPADGAGAAKTATDDFQNIAYASAYEIGAYSGTIVRTLYTSGIASGLSYGTHSVDQSISLSGVASSGSIGTPTVGMSIALDGIASGLVFGVSALGLRIDLNSISSALAIGTLSVVQKLAPRGIPSLLALGTHTLNMGVAMQGIASGNALGAHVVIWDQTLTPTAIQSTLSIGTLVVAAVYAFEDAAIALRTAVNSALSVSAVWDNAPEPPPSNALWARCAINFTSGQLLMIGNGNTYRRTGELVVQVSAPIGIGEGSSLTELDAVVAAVEDSNFDGLRLHVSTQDESYAEGGWWKSTVRIPFDFDETIALTGGTAGSVEDYESIRSILRQRADTVLSSLSVPVQYDNASVSKSDEDIWVRFSVLTSPKERVTQALYRVSGIAQATVYCPVGQGDGEALAIVDRLIRGFLPATHSGVTLRAPYATTLGRFGAWWHFSVSCPFYAEI
jgi:hypothetical protein